MQIRFLILLFLLSPLYVFAKCLDPIPDQYIVVTNNPDLIFESLNMIQNKLSPTKTFLYDHRNFGALKTYKYKQNLNESTLLLNLNSSQLNQIKNLTGTYVTSDCEVDLNNSILSQNNINTNASYENIAELTSSITYNDPLIKYQWALKNIDIEPKASQKTILIAVSDTGFDVSHEDLKESLWVNQAEINGSPGVDDDGNGCIDDFHGCDVADKDGNIGLNYYKSNLIDHGTHVAGIIAAQRNNELGIAGAAHNAKVMLIKSFSSKRRTAASDLIRSIYYAVDNGADIINCSWGTGAQPTLAEFNAFEYARLNNVIAVTAAGNGSTYASRTSPAGLSNVLTVGSYNANLQLSTFSNFGSAVDILAPGGDGFERRNDFIMSLTTNSQYIEKKGTSMAAPFISAILANLKSVYPNLNRNELINILLLSAEKKNVQAYFDPKYQDILSFVNQESAFKIAEQYQNQLYEISDLSFEPKTIGKPSQPLGLNNPYQQDNTFSENSGSGCTNHQNSFKAFNASIFLLLIPFLLILSYRKKE